MSDKSTQPRLDATKVSPDLYKTMLGLEKYVEGSGLEQKLLDLVKIRASQINGCAPTVLSCTPTTHASTAKATSGCTQRLARGADLQRARACSPRLDRSGDKDQRPSRTGRGVRRGASPFFRKGTCRPHRRGDRDQCLGPGRDRVSPHAPLKSVKLAA